jgi:hypothetical protein
MPDTSAWVPKKHPSETMDAAFFRQCHQVEQEILGRIAYEKSFNEHAFDSGWSAEEIIRQALRNLLPRRYHVMAGYLSDSKGYSAGDCDVIVFNDEWFPAIKSGPAVNSRRTYVPIEGAYSVLEVKQSLTRSRLEEAMQKLVKCSRLFRPPTPFDRIVENQLRNDCTHFISNSLYTGVVAAGLGDGVKLDSLVERFIRINQQLPRMSVVRFLCVLGHGTLCWAYEEPDAVNPDGSYRLREAEFAREDRFAELIPVYGRTEQGDSPFYGLLQSLMAHLFRSVLAPEGVATHYGGFPSAIRVPESEGATLRPDDGLLASLNDLCLGKQTQPDHMYHQHR